MNSRDHAPITIDKFGGLWQRGDVDNTPLDHFQDCNNIRFIGNSSFGTRNGIGLSQDVNVPLSNIKRIYNYPTQKANTLLVLTVNDGGEGSIHHVVDEFTVFGPLLTIQDMTDFAFVPYAGRAYISPFTSFNFNGLQVEKGLKDEFLYVYAGDGTAARKAAGNPLSGTITIANGAAGNTDAGLHIFGFVAETESGYLTAPGSLKTFVTSANNSVSFGSVPVGGATVTKRHLVASKKIDTFNGDLEGYTLYFVPDGTIDDNSTTSLNNVSFFDADLLEDASHLIDNYAEIPAGAVLSLYHNRLVLAATYDDISLALVSAVGEPEAIDQIAGLLVVPPDGNAITNAQELRDVLYAFKRNRTVAFTDNGDDPSTWAMVDIDKALGTCVHGIATVLDSGSATVDYLMVCTYQGVTLFTGVYITPELSWKIEAYWKALERNDFHLIQVVLSPITKEIYIVLPTRVLLVGNFANGMDPKAIRWTVWTYNMNVNSIAIKEIDEVVLGSDISAFSA